MPYLGSSPRNTNTRSVIDHQSYLGSQADTSTNSGYYTFYCNYTIGNVSVVLRGVHLANSDYIATNGTDIRIATSSITLNNDDVIEIIGHTVPSSQILERSDVNITGGAISNAVLNNTNTYNFLDDSISGDKIDGGTISDSVLKLKSSGDSIVASDGTTSILSESGNAVSIGTLRLPTSGGIQDSSGANVLTEASGTVTLSADEANVGSNSLVVDSSGNVIINENGNDADFRVESQNNSHALFLDNSQDIVSFGISNPVKTFSNTIYANRGLFGGFAIGTVYNSQNSNTGAVLLHRLGQGQGFQFSGHVIANSWTGQNFAIISCIARYTDDAVSYDLMDSSAVGIISQINMSFCTVSYDGGNYVAFVKTGGGTGNVHINGYLGSNMYNFSGVREIASGNYTITTTHVSW